MIGQLTQKFDQLATHNKLFKTQIAQQASSSNSNSQGKLLSQPEQNPRGHANAIFLRSGKEVTGGVGEDTKQDSSLEDEEKVEEGVCPF